ncbi:MAG: hypothetical protein M0Q49_03155 [Porticoccaceae bacterium]|nr:hypothetical protein [Porticoccaceae bacterium]
MTMRSKLCTSLAAIALVTASLTLTTYANGGEVDATAENHRQHERIVSGDKETRRHQMRERYEQMTPEEREALRTKRQELREQYKNMTPEERQAHHQEMCLQKKNLSAEECAAKYSEMKGKHHKKQPDKHKGKRKHKHGNNAK